jgi:hypothetical protein
MKNTEILAPDKYDASRPGIVELLKSARRTAARSINRLVTGEVLRNLQALRTDISVKAGALLP